ncbi:hypothetical protein DRP05_03005 [Archaeoglobales archaeon]|nr:MAG: hypothetical protein DRP05_03005 [Archaeoglobales archaeon]
MRSLQISSIEEYSGKSAFIIALGLILKEMGYKIGYFKPFGVNTTYVDGNLVDEDAYFTAKALNVKEDMDDICPVLLDKPYVEFVQLADAEELRKAIVDAYQKISENKDIVLVEGAVDYKVGRSIGICDLTISTILDTKVLMVVKYSNDFVLDRLLASKELFEDRLGLAVFNQLSGYKRTYVEGVAGALLQKSGMELVGLIPRDPILAGLFVSEIRNALSGDLLVEGKDMIIEQLIIGAMSPQSAIKYFRNVRNAALITGGDRVELHLVALEAINIKCLILTGNLMPSQVVLEKAKEKGIPIILVKDDTLTTMERLDELFGKARIKGEIKINRVKELVESFVDLKKITDYIGLDF